MRVVLDTNVILSSLLQPLGPPAKVLYLARRGFLDLCVSPAVYAEYEEVLNRSRFQRIEAEVLPMLEFIRERGLWVRALEPVRACSDPDDDIFLECAQAGEASFLVTGNTKDFPSEWRTTVVATPREFLDRLIHRIVR